MRYEERTDLHPSNDVMNKVRAIEQRGRRRHVPAIAFKGHEAIRTAGHDQCLLGTREPCVAEKGAPSHLTSSNISLWSSTPLLMAATVLQSMIMRAPSNSPWPHASKMSPSVVLPSRHLLHNSPTGWSVGCGPPDVILTDQL